VYGSYKKKPPKRTPVTIIERTASGTHWFKNQPIQFRENEKKWSTTVYSGGNNERRTLFVAILGEAGESLRDYFVDVHNKFKQSAGVSTLTPDIAICDEIEVLYRSQGGNAVPSKPGQEYGLKITSPKKSPTETVGEKISLVGTYLQVPTDKRVVIIEYVPRDQNYWFQGAVRFQQENNRWISDIEIGGDREMERVLQVAVLGPAGQALMDYFHLVADENKWVGVRTLTPPPDTIICDEVKVYFGRRSRAASAGRQDDES
jgi:hypothetical protein